MANDPELTGCRGACPLCGERVDAPATDYFGEATCHGCGESLVFFKSGREATFYAGDRGDQIRQRLVALLAEQFGVDVEKITAETSLIGDLGADSLDLVELALMLEEEEHG